MIIDETLVFFDLETGGLSHNNPIVQIAAIATDCRLKELESFEVKVKFNEADAHPESLKKNSYDRRLWALHGVEPKTAAERFSYFLRGHASVEMHSERTGKCYKVAQLVAHNANFDGPFLKDWYRKQDAYLPAAYRVYCTLQRAFWMFCEDKSLSPPPDFKLETLCQYFGISLHPNEAHDALADVRATVALYRGMVHSSAAGDSLAA